MMYSRAQKYFDEQFSVQFPRGVSPIIVSALGLNHCYAQILVMPKSWLHSKSLACPYSGCSQIHLSTGGRVFGDLGEHFFWFTQICVCGTLPKLEERTQNKSKWCKSHGT